MFHEFDIDTRDYIAPAKKAGAVSDPEEESDEAEDQYQRKEGTPAAK